MENGDIDINSCRKVALITGITGQVYTFIIYLLYILYYSFVILIVGWIIPSRIVVR